MIALLFTAMLSGGLSALIAGFGFGVPLWACFAIYILIGSLSVVVLACILAFGPSANSRQSEAWDQGVNLS